MAAAKYNLTIEQGATFKKSVTINNATTGLVRDLTGYTVRGMVRLSYDDVTPIATFTCIISAPLTGVFTFELSSVITAALDFEVAVYDLELVQTGSSPENVERIMQGNVYLSKEATK
jgi:hypothetical protein